jgi:phosphoserine phosphatase RsbU/P
MLNPEAVLDAMSEGVYVTDTDRRIIYWGKSAERITGWPADEVIGRQCHDGVLCHIDKDDHLLCGEEHCPLHRCMVTGRPSIVPITMFAAKKAGGRVPLQVAVSPMCDGQGNLIGGVETFRDLSQQWSDIDRARRVQQSSLHDVPRDPRIRFTAHYVPRDIVGGDYYAIGQLNEDRFAFLLADVVGHGIPAALFTMYLNLLWSSHGHLLNSPPAFASTLNDQLNDLAHEDEPFTAAICGTIDLKEQVLRVVGAGNPGPLIARPGRPIQQVQVGGLPLGAVRGTTYPEVQVPLGRGDCLLFFTDGATEIPGGDGECLDAAGLIRVVQEVGYPGRSPQLPKIEERLLASSNRIRFDDDLTLLDVRLT